MSADAAAALSLGGMFVLLAAGMHVGFAMALAGLVGSMLLLPVDSALALFGQTVFETALSYDFIVIPLFVLMGQFAAAGGLSEDLYEAFNTWLGARPGGLGLATIGSCGAFAAICGSSLATAAAMSKVALPEMERRGYDPRLSTGAVAAGGTIGILIPPSVVMVLYGILTETSIADMFLAGIVPGALLVLLFLATVWALTRAAPALGPPGPPTARRDKLRAFRRVRGTVALFALVLGGIYLGVFTPIEAAGIGAVGALALGVLAGRMGREAFAGAVLDAVDVTAVIFTILIGAIAVKNLIALLGFPAMIEGWILAMNLPPLGVLAAMLAIYVLLGAVLDTMAMILLTLPVFFPIVAGLGFDAVWFGILVVIVVELALISPPMGINVFVIKGMVPEMPLATIYVGVLPFAAAQAVLLVLVLLVPDLALWLPRTAP